MAASSEPRALPPPNDSPRPAMNLAEIPEAVLVKRYGTTRAEVEAVKKAIAPANTTDFELMLYLGVCHRLGLDPFVPGLIHFAQFWNKEKNAYRTAVVIGYLGYLEIAQQQRDMDGFEVRSFPEDASKTPDYATATVWKKNWSHPIVVKVLYKEKRAAANSSSKYWETQPREALERAALRRALKMGWPSLFAPLEDDDEGNGSTHELPEVRGRMGTTLGEHHDVPAIEAPPEGGVSAPEEPAREAEFVPAGQPPAEKPEAAPAPPPLAGPSPEVEEVAKSISYLMEDPALDPDTRKRMENYLNARLDFRNLQTTRAAKYEDVPFLRELLGELRKFSPRPSA